MASRIFLSPELTDDSGWSNDDSSTASEDVENLSVWNETKPTVFLNGYTLLEAGTTEEAVGDTSTAASYPPLIEEMDTLTDGVQTDINELKQKLEKTATEVKELGGRVSLLERNKEATSSEFVSVRRTFGAVHKRVNGLETLVRLQGRVFGQTSGVSEGELRPGPQPQRRRRTRLRSRCPHCLKNLTKSYVKIHIRNHCPNRPEGMAPRK